MLRTVLRVFVLGLGVLVPAATAAGQEPSQDAAYIERGHRTEARQKAYHERIDRFYEALSEAVRQAAPDLLPEIASPPPDVHGYQILPEIGADDPAPAPGTTSEVVRFSWNVLDTGITRQMRVLERLERTLRTLPRVPTRSSRASYASLAADYTTVVDRRRMIDQNIAYNWLWQQRIEDDRPLFDRLKKIQDAALERDAIASVLASGSDAILRTAGGTLGFDVALGAESLREALSERLRDIGAMITAATRAVSPSDFVTIEHPAPGRWLVRVPLYTDVLDSTLVRDFKNGVEGWWHIRDGDEEFRLELEVETFSPEQLYCAHADDTRDSNADCAPPTHGAEIDLEAHVARFPEGGAVLTTGATTLMTTGPRAIVLGPDDTVPRVLAHEFGHILGFPDTYFRGYRDLGADGFEITELADLTDIMGAPGAGPVVARHFEKLFAGKARAWLNVSFESFNQGRFGDSIDAARQALTLNPDYAEAYNNVAAAHAALARWDDAIHAARQAISLKPDFQLAKNNLAWATTEKTKAGVSQQAK
jgi:tetratricopeptide (TPR) repeat protein